MSEQNLKGLWLKVVEHWADKYTGDTPQSVVSYITGKGLDRSKEVVLIPGTEALRNIECGVFSDASYTKKFSKNGRDCNKIVTAVGGVPVPASYTIFSIKSHKDISGKALARYFVPVTLEALIKAIAEGDGTMPVRSAQPSDKSSEGQGRNEWVIAQP